jgi:hypothetical protein
MNRESTSRNTLFTLVKEGMEVIDIHSKRLGKVEYVRFGDDTPRDDYPTEAAPEEIIQSIADDFAGKDDMPEELREHLLRYGYFRLGSGLIHKDYFVTPDQVARVSNNQVELNVTTEELLEF